MLKILIVDDLKEKSQKICEILQTINTIEKDNIHFVENLLDAFQLLKTNVYDIVILDIQIPRRKGEPPLIDGGIRFLEQIEFGEVNYPLSIVGITSFDESIIEYEEYFQNHLWSLIKYDETTNEWSQRIRNKVEYIVSYKKNQISRMELYDYDIGIVCALFRLELENVRKVIGGTWDEINIPNDDSTKYYICQLVIGEKKAKIVAAAAPQMGMPAATVVATKMINHFKPRYLAMAGIAAGVQEKGVQLGDILAADPSWDYGAGKIKDNSGKRVFLQDSKQLRIDSDLQSMFQELSTNRALLNEISEEYTGKKPHTKLSLHLGPLASGAAVIADKRVVKEIALQSRNLIGIEMETYGVYCAGYYGCEPKPKFFSIKSACDYADADKDDDYQDYAAFTSARMLKHIISAYISR